MGNGTASNEQSANTRLIVGRHIVHLAHGLTLDTYQRHVNSVKILLKGQKTPVGKNAEIVDVLSYPIGNKIPLCFCYIVDINPNLAEKIKTLTNVLSISPDSTVPLNVNIGLTESRSNNWGLGYMSQKDQLFTDQQNAYTSATNTEKRSGEFYRYWGLPSRGAGSTVYVIDSGFDPEYLKLPNSEIQPNKLKFYDPLQFRLNIKKLTEEIPGDFSDWDDGHVKKTLTCWDNHKLGDCDVVRYHGTNVSLLACGSKRGMAPGADLVVFDCGEINQIPTSDDDLKPPTVCASSVITALFGIVNFPGEKKRSVLSCSWLFDSTDVEYELISSLFGFLHQQGVHLVGAAGQAASPTSGAKALKMNTNIPSTLPYATCVGNWTASGTRNEYSNYPDTVGAPNMIWAPGTGIIVYRGKSDASKKSDLPKTAGGTSYATPVVAGLIACVLAESKEDKVDFNLLQTKLAPFIRSDDKGDVYLWWGNQR